MNTILLIIAVIFFVAAIIIGSVTPDSWKSTGITWMFNCWNNIIWRCVDIINR